MRSGGLLIDRQEGGTDRQGSQHLPTHDVTTTSILHQESRRIIFIKLGSITQHSFIEKELLRLSYPVTDYYLRDTPHVKFLSYLNNLHT